MSKAIYLAAALSFVSETAFAHITLDTGEAAVGSSYKAVFRVPHGCAGAPTIAVRVRIPEGMISAKPMPKPGWTLEKLRNKYARSYDYYGTELGEGVTEITWKGGSLGDDEYDEFVVRGFLAADLPVGEMLYFPVVQECPDGKVERWIEVPASGQTSDDLELPAPAIKLLGNADAK